MNWEEYVKKHKELVDELEPIKKRIEELNKICLPKELEEGEPIPFNRPGECDEWDDLFERFTEISKKIWKLSEEYWKKK